MFPAADNVWGIHRDRTTWKLRARTFDRWKSTCRSGRAAVGRDGRIAEEVRDSGAAGSSDARPRVEGKTRDAVAARPQTPTPDFVWLFPCLANRVNPAPVPL